MGSRCPVLFYIVLKTFDCLFVRFHLGIALPVARHARSDYPFGNFKLLINLNVSDSLSFLEVRVILIIEECLVTLR